MIFTMQNLQEGVSEIQNGKYVDFEVPAAYHAIVQTQNLGNDWDVFLNNAPQAVLNAVFHPLLFDEVETYIEHELQNPPNNQTEFTAADITKMLDNCKVYGQRRRIAVKGTKARPFIFRTPNASEFDKARAVFVLILELYRRFGNSLNDSHSIPGVTMTIRKDEKFFDVKIDEINVKAWCGFDFR